MSTLPPEHLDIITSELGLSASSVSTTAKLLGEGATVPFIARYRKEATGSLDEVQIQAIRDRIQQLADLDYRRKTILKSLEERKLLTPELKKKILAAKTMNNLEDIFAPYRPKRQTRATKAKEKGLEPLADWLLENQEADPEAEAKDYLNEEKEVSTAAEALDGARDIIAERVADHAELREKVRSLYEEESQVTSRVMYGKEEDPAAAKFRDYFEWSEAFQNVPSHRMLAMRRGEKEMVLFMRVELPVERVHAEAVPIWVSGKGEAAEQVRLAVEDGCKRLLMSSMETEMRMQGKKQADETAIKVFADNLRELLLASPLGRLKVLAIDPAFRTGCKTVVLDAQGSLLHHTVLHATAGSQRQALEAGEEVKHLVKTYGIQAIAIGNGTASRETETFVKKLKLPASIPVVVVNESGASIYSASEVAREEFPNEDVTVRGAVSIGRRLMDPLSELVKIDPKAIGVGQYQHDVDQRLLKAGLDDVVVSCVNGVGVELNTASKKLLSYVSGLNDTLAGNIVAWREENGPFQTRKELKKVNRLGEKAFEQAAGFLRIREASNPLDASAVHPERYRLVERMAADLGCEVADLIKQDSLRKKIDLKKYVDEEVGLPTLKDIIDELSRPGRDPRKAFEAFSFAEGVEKPGDLSDGMRLPGIVTNVTAFGAFVDVGVHQDGLVHVSQLADHFVKDPAEVVKVGQKVQVTVTEIDLSRNRISLSMKSAPDRDGGERRGGGGGNRNSRQDRSRPQNRRPQRSQSQRQQKPETDWFTQAMNQAKKK